MRSLVVTLLSALTVAVLPADAVAAPVATTIGQLGVVAGGSCNTGQTNLMITSGSFGPSYTVPAGDWVVASWSTAPLGGNGTEKLVIARPTATALTYQAQGVSATGTIGGPSSTYATRIPTKGGDIIGLNPLSGSFACSRPGGAGDLVRQVLTNPATGDTLVASSGTASLRLNVTTSLEPDADVDGYGDVTQDGCVTDAASFTTCGVPAVTGTTEAGGTLTATLGGTPSNPALQWQRCDGAGGSCADVAGATGATLLLTAADVGATFRVRQTASNASGTQSTDSGPTAVVTTKTVVVPPPPPTPKSAVLGTVHLSSRTWATKKGSHHRVVGTTMTFTLDVAASVRVDISRLVGGRTVKGKCVAETRKNRTKRSCTRRLSAGRVTIPGRAGADTVFFGGRTDGGSTLKPGHYRATVTALVAGGPASASRTVKFTVATP